MDYRLSPISPLQNGFINFVAIVVDFFFRNVLTWKLSINLDTVFSLDVLERALERGRKPQIFHSDQGCPFTSLKIVAWLQMEDIEIIWSGRTRCYDNILVESFWRIVQHEEVYPHA